MHLHSQQQKQCGLAGCRDESVRHSLLRPLVITRGARAAGLRSLALLTAPSHTRTHQSREQAYNMTMNRQMGWSQDGLNPYEYHPQRGLYYHEVHPALYCGTQLRSTADVDYLRDTEGIDVIVNLQENKDFHYWDVPFHDIYHHAVARGVEIKRRPAVDFDPNSLRRTLPVTVRLLHEAISTGRKVYVHCTAGLGRAPAVCIAYNFWYHDVTLDEAYTALTRIRPCGPKREAIRGATYDLAWEGGARSDFSDLPLDAYATLTKGQRSALQHRIKFWE